MARQKNGKSFEISTIRGTVDKARSAGKDKPYWRARLKGGTRKLVWSGWATRDEAMDEVAKLVARGVQHVSRRSAGEMEVRTIGDLMAVWLDYQESLVNPPGGTIKSGICPRTADFYDKAARHINELLGEVSVSRMAEEDVQAYIAGRSRERASPRLVAVEQRVLQMAWKWGRKRQYTPNRDLPMVAVPIDENSFHIAHYTPTRAEAARVLRHLQGEWHLLGVLLATTGARVGEVAHLRAKDWNPRRGTLHLGRDVASQKTGRRDFPLPPHVARLLAGRPSEGDGYLLDLPVAHRTEAFRSRLKRACEKEGFTGDDRFTPHGLRRMVVQDMARADINIKTAAKLMGHTVEVMLRYYQEVTEQDMANAVRKARLGVLEVPSEKGQVLGGPWSGGPDDES